MSTLPNKTGTYDADVIIVGGGPAGLTMTALLAANGVKTICIDRDNPASQIKQDFDGRTIAVSYGSRQVLEAAGIWDSLENKACPINTIQILDEESPVLLKFDKSEVDDRTFGWIAEMRDIRTALFDKLATEKHAHHKAPAAVSGYALHKDEKSVSVHLQDGTSLSAPLVIGADGRNSFTREWMGIDTRGWSYRQKAVVCVVHHENPHQHIAVEHFRPEGPFAVLPMKDDEQGRHRSSLVWTEHYNTRDKSAMDYDDEVFNAALNSRFPEFYGRVGIAGPRFSYPLGLIHAHQYIGPRMALIADAAHGIHPIAGQGLNLGFRDIACLTELITTAVKNKEDPGADALLATYQKQRRFDNMAMAGATDALTRLFSNDIAPVGIVRKIGLRAVAKLPHAKGFFMKQAMGHAGLLPSLIKENKVA